MKIKYPCAMKHVSIVRSFVYSTQNFPNANPLRACLHQGHCRHVIIKEALKEI